MMMKLGARSINLEGQRFNKLLVLEYVSKSKDKQSLWKCQCDCGNITNVRAGQLRSNHTKSCGCLRREFRRLPKGEAAFNQLFIGYKKDAEKRNLGFDLLNEEFRYLTKQNCYYCGAEPSQEKKGSNNPAIYIYNGIDRVNTSKGYTLDNCVPCCKVCNIAKHNMKQDDFLYWIAKAYSHQAMQIEYT